LERVIVHVDLDQFIAAVELHRRPELCGRQVIVGGSGDRQSARWSRPPRMRHGALASTPACARASRCCPDAVFLAFDRPVCQAASIKVRETTVHRTAFPRMRVPASFGGYGRHPVIASPCIRYDNPGMTVVDSRQLLMLERLRRAGGAPVTFAELRAGGIDFPAVVVGELELHGYVIERVYERGRLVGVRLSEADADDARARRPRRRRGWTVR
jgi:hypothetical protein